MPSRKQHLITSMHKTTKFRGHKMVLADHEQVGRKFWGEWSCSNCSMTAYVDTYPSPNGIDVYGQAVALNCEGSKKDKDNTKMTIETFEVKNPVALNDSEHMAVENKEALFFFHSYIRTDWELIEIAHSLLLEFGENCNYEQTREYRDIESINRQIEKEDKLSGQSPTKYRLNCPFSGKIEWHDATDMAEIEHDLIIKLSDYISEVYSLENYGCFYFEGDWGLWPYEIDQV